MESLFYSKSVKSAGEFQGFWVKPRQNSHHPLYATHYTGIGHRKVNNQEINLQQLSMSFAPGQSACYHFEDNTSYAIELINNTPLPIYNGITTVFGFGVVASKFISLF